MRKVNNEFINLSKKVKIQDLKLTINDGELTVQEVHLMPVNIFNAIPISRLRARKQVIAKELKYSFEGQLFKTIMQQIEITVKNASEIKGKYVDFQYGIQINNEFEYVDIGEYYIKDVEDDKKKEELVVTGYDKMLNFMIPFKQSELQLTYPCKMSQLVNRMGEVCGVELYSTDFFNSDLIVDEDFFTAQELTYRDVLEKVAEATLTTIFIKENKLYLCKIGDSVQTLDTSYLSNLVVGDKFGPVNALVLGRGSVEDNIESIDEDSINTNGRCEIRFDENEFLDSKREDVIDAMLQQINGLEYYAIEASNLGLLWLEPCDVIIAKDREESEYKSIYLKANVTINTGIKGEMEAVIPDTTTTEYKVTTKELKKTLKVERFAKKNEGLIQDLVEEVGDRTEKETSITQDIDSISQRVKNMADLTNTVEGNRTITLENCVEGDLLELHIYGNNNVFKYLYPSDTLYPSDELYPYGDSRIIVEHEDKTSVIYELGVLDVLRQNGEVQDEYILQNGKAKIIRRVNNNGTTKTIEEIENLGEYAIKLKEGKNTITIQNYNAKLNAKFAIKNDYTEIFATRVEMNSSITQTAEEINLEVSKKVDENEIISKINQSAERISIEAEKINLSGKILNLADNMAIVSNNFNVDSKGNMTCNNANITGGDIQLSAGDNKDMPVFRVKRKNGDKYAHSYINPKYWGINTATGWGAVELGINHDSEVYGGEEGFITVSTQISETSGTSTSIYGKRGIITPSVTQTSREEQKKNFEKLENGLDIINNTEIYKYNLKSQADGDKKHIGFIIGKNYKYSKEITALDNEGKEVGVDTYSMISVAYKAIQEQQELIKQLQERIKELEEK